MLAAEFFSDFHVETASLVVHAPGAVPIAEAVHHVHLAAKLDQEVLAAVLRVERSVGDEDHLVVLEARRTGGKDPREHICHILRIILEGLRLADRPVVSHVAIGTL